VGENAIGSIAFHGPSPKTPYRCKNLADISYTDRVIALFVKNFVVRATRVGREKIRLAAFNGSSPQTLLWTQKFRRYILHRPSYTQFCPKFRCHGNGGRSGENAIGSIRWPIPENFSIGARYRKNLIPKPSYSQFCFKFRCHGNGGWSGENAIGSIQWPIPENPPIGAKISQKSLTQAEL